MIDCQYCRNKCGRERYTKNLKTSSILTSECCSYIGNLQIKMDKLIDSIVFIFFVKNQVVEDGYEFFAKRQLVTLFSAPNYCGEFDNAGGMMTVDESLLCSFQVRIKFIFMLIEQKICTKNTIFIQYFVYRFSNHPRKRRNISTIL